MHRVNGYFYRECDTTQEHVVDMGEVVCAECGERDCDGCKEPWEIECGEAEGESTGQYALIDGVVCAIFQPNNGEPCFAVNRAGLFVEKPERCPHCGEDIDWTLRTHERGDYFIGECACGTEFNGMPGYTWRYTEGVVEFDADDGGQYT